MGGRFARIFQIFAAIIAGLVITLSGIGAAAAQDLSGLEITVTPYLWLGGPHATINTPLASNPKVTTNKDFSDVIGSLNGVPFMGAFEIRQGPFAFDADLIHLPVAANFPTKNLLFHGGSAALTTTTGTALVMYRPYVDALQTLDVGIGMRAWGFSADLKFNAGLLPSVSLTRSASWGDALAAARYHRELGDGFGVTAYGDVGGGGAKAVASWHQQSRVSPCSFS